MARSFLTISDAARTQVRLGRAPVTGVATAWLGRVNRNSVGQIMLLDSAGDVDRDRIIAVSEQLGRLDDHRLGLLRFMDPFGRGNAEFWQLYARSALAEPAELWQRQVRLMAWLASGTDASRKSIGPHNSTRGVGKVLRETGYPEDRLLQLLSCPAASRWDRLDHLVRWLAPRWDGQGVDCLALWQLQQSHGRAAERTIAGEYFDAQVIRGGRGFRAPTKRSVLATISRKLGF